VHFHLLPLTVRFVRLPNSTVAGKGKFHGGDGIERHIIFNAPLTVSMLANRRVVPPFGLDGGEPGQVGENYLERANGEVVPMGHRGSVEVEPGDKFVIKTPGGGGFGKPKA
jgi:N-methylhydantoinase B/oxoprolinase/acetone carboxylase alpha subunit